MHGRTRPAIANTGVIVLEPDLENGAIERFHLVAIGRVKVERTHVKFPDSARHASFLHCLMAEGIPEIYTPRLSRGYQECTADTRGSIGILDPRPANVSRRSPLLACIRVY